MFWVMPWRYLLQFLWRWIIAMPQTCDFLYFPMLYFFAEYFWSSLWTYNSTLIVGKPHFHLGKKGPFKDSDNHLWARHSSADLFDNKRPDSAVVLTQLDSKTVRFPPDSRSAYGMDDFNLSNIPWRISISFSKCSLGIRTRMDSIYQIPWILRPPLYA